jgi:hypothetical protein
MRFRYTGALALLQKPARIEMTRSFSGRLRIMNRSGARTRLSVHSFAIIFGLKKGLTSVPVLFSNRQ